MANAWFPRLTDGQPTWALREAVDADSTTLIPNPADLTASGLVSESLRDRTLTPGVGGAVVIGLASDPVGNYPRPGVGAISLAPDLFPTIVTVAGPYAAPDRTLVSLDGRTPFLQRIRIVYPLLPDSPDAGDTALAPTILLGNSSSAGVPGRAQIDVWGNQPLLIGDGSFRAEVPAQVPKLVATGLAPTVVPDVMNEPSKTPRVGLAEIFGRAPTLIGELQQEAGLGSVTMGGLAPELVGLRYDWQTVALTGAAVWTDVPAAE